MCYVAFTPKGGCPLKRVGYQDFTGLDGSCSIHPQGWVPIETRMSTVIMNVLLILVAFTPKGGCPLKRLPLAGQVVPNIACSIHPQGWVLIETC